MRHLRRMKSAVAGVVFGATALAAAVVPYTQAMAQQDNGAAVVGGILGVILGAAMIENAKKGWQQIDPDVRDCVAQQQNIDALINNGIGPNDSRIAPLVNSCANYVNALRYARQSWEGVDSQTRACLISRYNLNPDNLANQGVAANDQRLAYAFNGCAQFAEGVANARRSWGVLDSEVKSCVTSRFGLSPDSFAEQGIGTEDPRAAGAVNACAQELATQKDRHERLLQQYGPDIAAAIEAHTVLKGMTREAVREAIGDPIQNPDIVPPNMEMWTYNGRHIIFTNNRVTRIDD